MVEKTVADALGPIDLLAIFEKESESNDRLTATFCRMFECIKQYLKLHSIEPFVEQLKGFKNRDGVHSFQQVESVGK